MAKSETEVLGAFANLFEAFGGLGIAKPPGQDVRYVVVDGAKRLPERVRLPFELDGGYDAEFYSDLLVRACESVVSPMGWDRGRIRTYLRERWDVGLAAFD